MNDPVVSASAGMPSDGRSAELVAQSVTGVVQAPLATVAVSPPAPLPPANAEKQPPATAGLLVFKTTASSWVEVTDARGAIILRRLMVAGESASISGTLPLTVLVGRADVTTVEVRGKPMDLAGISRDNVARFEVK
jgi:cytoskeleton protein RodZ